MSQDMTKQSVGAAVCEAPAASEACEPALFEMGTLSDTKGGLQGFVYDGGFGVKPV